MNVNPGSPVPFDCSVQLGGGYGTTCYREWGNVADALLGKGFSGIRRALNVWARNTHGVWFLRNPDERDCAVFEIHSATGFQQMSWGIGDEPVFDKLLFRISMTHNGNVYSYEVIPSGQRS